MPKKKASESSSDTSVHSSDEESKKPAKKQKTDNKKGKSSKDDGIESWEIGRMRTVKLKEFRGKMYVDIREYYEKNGDILPGKKGISLSVDQWNKFSSLVGEIDKALKDNC